MKVSKKLQKKRKADKRTIGIVVCVIVIAIALGVVIFLPSNTVAAINISLKELP